MGRTTVALERFAYGRWNSFPTPPGEDRPFEQDVKSIYEDHLHRVWYAVRSQPGRYFCVQNGVLSIYSGLPKDAFVTYQDSAGYLWLNEHSAHPARWKQGKLYPIPELHTSYLLNVIERSDGMVWVGSIQTILFQYRPPLISSIPTAGVPEVGSVLFQQRNGDIWAGGTDLLHLAAGAEKAKGESAFRPLYPGSRDRETIEALSEDSQGHLLIGARNHPGGEMLLRGKRTPYLVGGLDNTPIRAMLLSSSGDQWIGTDTALYRYRKDPGAKPERLWTGAVRCLVEASSHAIWAGTNEGPLRFEDGRRQPLAAGPAWSYGAVQSISVDRLGALWMTTLEHGIVRFAAGGFRVFDTTDGLASDAIYSVNFGDDDDLWLRSDVGLMRVRRRSIERRLRDPASKLQMTLFDQADGLPAPNMAPAGNQGFLHLDGGTFWFATPGGIASLHPSDFLYQASSPHAIVEEHVIDQSGLLPGTQIVLAPGQGDLELHYTALGSRRPEQVNFRYCLRGFDHGWIVAGTRRVAYYTHLPPGDYSFEVQAADGDGDLWEGTGAGADVRVLTPFYRTWWMNLLLCCVLLGSLLLFVQARQRILRERHRMRQAFTHRLIATQEGERKRIAHELHDSLGQHLVLIRTLALLPTAPSTTARGDHLAKIADQAAVAIQEVESISYDLRPYQLDRLGLTRTILSLVETFQATGPVHMTHSLEHIDGFFPKDMEINVYRIVQEALANILKHAQATEATVTVARAGSTLRLVVADNGRGFATSANGSSRRGLGLIGMQERAEALGGQALIESGDRSGTRVIVTVTRTS